MRKAPSRSAAVLAGVVFFLNIVSCGGGGGGGGSNGTGVPSEPEALLTYENQNAATSVTNILDAYGSIDTFVAAVAVGSLFPETTDRNQALAILQNDFIAPLQSAETALNATVAAESQALSTGRTGADTSPEITGIEEAFLWFSLTAAAAAVGGLITWSINKKKECEAHTDPALFWGCLRDMMVGGGSVKVLQTAANLHPANPLNNLPSGTIKVIVEGAQVQGNIETLQETVKVIGTECGATGQRNRAETMKTPTEAGSVYIGWTDGNGDLSDVPEGNWTFGFFHDGLVRHGAQCVAVNEGETTQVTWPVTTITSATTPTTTPTATPTTTPTPTPSTPDIWLIGIWDITGIAYNSCAWSTVTGYFAIANTGYYNETATWRGYNCDGSSGGVDEYTVIGQWSWDSGVFTYGSDGTGCVGTVFEGDTTFTTSCGDWTYTLTAR